MSDSSIAPLWLAVNALLGWAMFRLARRLFPADTRLALVGHTTLLGYAAVVAVGTASGACGLLGPRVLLLATTTVSVSILAVLRRGGPCGFPARTKGLEATAEVSAGVVPPQTSRPTDWSGVFEWGWFGAFLGYVTAHVVLGGLLRFPSDWDTLMYHLPLVDHWLQVGGLYAPDCLHWYVPGNNELITLWCVAPFSGDFLYSVTNLPATVLLVCGSLEVGRQLGLGVIPRSLAALAVAANRIVLQQLLDVENDVAVAGLFLAGLGYGFRYAATGRLPDLVLAATAIGLLAGVKYYALGYAAVAAATTIGLVIWQWGWLKGTRVAVYALGGLFAFGSYWYLRNLAVTGAPCYPLGAASEAEEIRSQYPNMWATTFVGNSRPDLWRLTGEAIWRMTGPCHFVAFAAFPLSVCWLLVAPAFRPASRPGAGATGPAFAAAVLGACGVIAVTPFAVEDSPGTLNQIRWGYCPVRYGLSFLSLVVLGLGVLFRDLSRVTALGVRAVAARVVPTCGGGHFASGTGVLFSSVFVIGIAFQLTQNPLSVPVEPIDALLAGVTVGSATVALRFAAPAARRRLPTVVLAGAALLAAGSGISAHALSTRWHVGYARAYDFAQGDGLFEYMTHQLRAGQTVCVLDPRPYPFFGSARQFRICQPPHAHPTDSCGRYLLDRGVQLVATRSGSNDDAVDHWEPFRAWLQRHPKGLEPIGNHPWSWAIFDVRGDLLRPGRDE